MVKKRKKIKDKSRFPKVTDGYEGQFKNNFEQGLKRTLRAIAKKIKESNDINTKSS